MGHITRINDVIIINDQSICEICKKEKKAHGLNALFQIFSRAEKWHEFQPHIKHKMRLVNSPAMSYTFECTICHDVYVISESAFWTGKTPFKTFMEHMNTSFREIGNGWYISQLLANSNVEDNE